MYPMLKNSTILYIFENNLGKEHDHLTALIDRTSNINNVKVLYEHESVVGFHTGPGSKLPADDRLRSYVSTDGLRFAKNIISVDPASDPSGDDIIEKLIHQIEEMREFVRYKANGTHDRVVTSTHGIDRKRIRGNKDDLQRALSMLLIVAGMFYERKLKLNYDEIERLHLKRRHLREDIHFVEKRVRQTWAEQKRSALQETNSIYELVTAA